ncbi:MAG: hypothetical protein J5713_04250 [Clostridia bacterium]|nr:hypothetical protein [Clostridia bacterium]
MKSASKAMYTIGRVFNIIALIGMIIVLAVGIFFMVTGKTVTGTDENGAEVELDGRAVGVIMTAVGAVFSVIYLVLILLAGHARKALNNDKTENAPHILMIIIGIFGDIFYLLGGIFGLVAEHEGENENN